MVIRVEGALGIQAVDRIIQAFKFSNSNTKFIIDLRMVNEVSIECISWLVVVLLYINKCGQSVRLIAPNDNNPALYRLKMWRFFDVLRDEGVYESRNKNLYIHADSKKNWIISVRLLKSNKDIQNVISGVMDDLDFCFKKMRYEKKRYR